MASRLIALLFPFFLVSSVSGHNITNLLSQFSDFSSLNDLLSQTKLASEINSRQTITVLAAGNKAISDVSDQPAYILKRILALHVILDYYDSNKLAAFTNKTVMLSTLFQAIGHTTGHNGFLNLTNSGGNQVVVRSSQPGAKYDAHIVRLVASQPYNVSVLEISNLIVPPAIGANYSFAPGPGPNGGPRPAPGGGPRRRNVPVPSPAPAFAPGVADAPGSFGIRTLPVTAGRVISWAVLAVAASLGVF